MAVEIEQFVGIRFLAKYTKPYKILIIGENHVEFEDQLTMANKSKAIKERLKLFIKNIEMFANTNKKHVLFLVESFFGKKPIWRDKNRAATRNLRNIAAEVSEFKNTHSSLVSLSEYIELSKFVHVESVERRQDFESWLIKYLFLGLSFDFKKIDFLDFKLIYTLNNMAEDVDLLGNNKKQAFFVRACIKFIKAFINQLQCYLPLEYLVKLALMDILKTEIEWSEKIYDTVLASLIIFVWRATILRNQDPQNLSRIIYNFIQLKIEAESGQQINSDEIIKLAELSEDLINSSYSIIGPANEKVWNSYFIECRIDKNQDDYSNLANIDLKKCVDKVKHYDTLIYTSFSTFHNSVKYVFPILELGCVTSVFLNKYDYYVIFTGAWHAQVLQNYLTVLLDQPADAISQYPTHEELISLLNKFLTIGK